MAREMRRAARGETRDDRQEVRVAEAGSYSRLIDSCITQLKAQGPSRTCNESKEALPGHGVRPQLARPRSSEARSEREGAMCCSPLRHFTQQIARWQSVVVSA